MEQEIERAQESEAEVIGDELARADVAGAPAGCDGEREAPAEGDASGEHEDEVEEAAPSRAERGVALLMVIACLAVLMPITASFSYTTRVDWQAAINLRDEVTARSLERGAMRLSLLMFELQRTVFSQKQFRENLGAMDITQVAPYLMSVFGSEDGAEGLVGMAALVGVDGINTEAFQQLALTTGTFEVRLEAESGKINVNCLAQTQGDGKNNPQQRTIEMLDSLLLPSLYDPLFEEESSDGQYYSRYGVVKRIVDYIDDDRRVFDIVRMVPGSGAESSYHYRDFVDPFEARDARLDSVAELTMIESVNDDIMNILRPELTVYGGCKVNLNFASAQQVAIALRYGATPEDKWKTEGENFTLMTVPLANYIVSVRDLTLFDDIKAFREFAEKPDQFFNPLLSLGAGDQGAEGFGATELGMPRVPEGIRLNEKGAKPEDGDEDEVLGAIEDIATVEPERVYRLEVITEVGMVKKRLSAVYDMQATRTQSTGKGAWLYFRED
ncbi:MAG: general secretion pathway protein GspK [Myxococcales bacterium]|nr:general secretion pathway protein GspK [Myxococcales bacterium]MCB9756068.1 general secretion pathway protein GspK [Myxococcales bacterium]